MGLNPAQLATLKADIIANTNTIMLAGVPTAINATPNTLDVGFQIALDWYNIAASPTFWVWQTTCPVQAIYDRIVWKRFTPIDSVPVLLDLDLQIWQARSLSCQGKQFNLQTLLLGRTVVDARNSNFRDGLKDSLQELPSNTGGALFDAGWADVRNAMSRVATYGQKLFSTGVGTQTDAGVMAYESPITGNEIKAARDLA